MSQRFRRANGQSLVEFAVILPFTVVLVLGVIELGYALLDQHVVAKLTREGSNLISRDTSLGDAGKTLKGMATRPVNFDTGSKMIFSVIRRGGTTGTSNFGKDILYQRYASPYGTWPSELTTRGAGAFGPGPEYQAINADGDTNLQVTNLPANLIVANNAMVYITEVFTSHPLITPFDKFGITVPTTLYSIAYF
jgi:Flp pilus assembly protein TadG